VQTLHNIYQEATSKHITLLASTGDEGAAQWNCAGTALMRSASWPADDPLVTSVGATSLTANLTTGAYGSEIAWSDDNSGGCYPASQFGCSGGGFSNIFTRPSYQASTPGTNWAHRGVPDVAYNGGVNGGVLTHWGVGLCAYYGDCAPDPNSLFIFGGTSAGSPQWAGLVALTDQLYRGRIGSIDTTLYRIAASPSLYRTAFHDITSGNNNFPNVDATTIFGYRTANGWDPVTGLGTPKANVLVPLLVS
jgi:subtilase family serine protease